MKMTDVQNYLFSFFAGVYFPPTDDLDALKEEIRKDLDNGIKDN